MIVLVAIVLGVVDFLLNTLLLMLVLGALHAEVNTSIPALGFGQTLLTAFTLTVAGALLSLTSRTPTS